MSIVWNERTAAHLLRRAGFGGTWSEIQQAVRDGMDATVSRLVDYETIDDSALETRLASAGIDLTAGTGIVRWWLIRMMYTTRPLAERMTFFWHDHFATGLSKVNDRALMLQQNQTLRNRAMGNFEPMLLEVSKDPAMLVWLDNWLSRKEHPNENYGRELLELFGLGIGNYTEDDVMAAARAFTGWTLNRSRQFLFNAAWHDTGQKTFLGQTGNWDGGDIVRMVVRAHASAHLVAGKLFSYFAYENPEHETVEKFAQIYINGNFEIRPLVRAILTSDEMYSDKAIWQKVKSPVESVVISTRQLMMTRDMSRAALTPISAQGQVLFNPPDVSGWISGFEWINSGTLLSRVNWGNSVAELFDIAPFFAGATINTPAALVDTTLQRLGPVDVPAETRQALLDYVAPSGSLPAGTALTAKQRGLVQLVLGLPEWQMN